MGVGHHGLFGRSGPLSHAAMRSLALKHAHVQIPCLIVMVPPALAATLPPLLNFVRIEPMMGIIVGSRIAKADKI